MFKDRGYKVVLVDPTGVYKENILNFFNDGNGLTIHNMKTTNKDLKGELGYKYIDKQAVGGIGNKILKTKKNGHTFFTTRKDINDSDLIFVENPLHIIELAKEHKNTLFLGYNFILDEKDEILLKAKKMIDNGFKNINIDEIKSDREDEIYFNAKKLFDLVEGERVDDFPQNLYCVNMPVNATFSDFGHTTGSLIDFFSDLDVAIEKMNLFCDISDTFKFKKNENGEVLVYVNDPEFKGLEGIKKCVLPLILAINGDFDALISTFLDNIQMLEMVSTLSLEDEKDFLNPSLNEEEDSLFINGEEDDPDKNILLS